MREIMICEVLKPNEVFLLWKDNEGIMYCGNNKGKAFMCKALFPLE